MSNRDDLRAELESLGLCEDDLELDEFRPEEFLTTKVSIEAFLESAYELGDAEHFKSALKIASRSHQALSADLAG